MFDGTTIGKSAGVVQQRTFDEGRHLTVIANVSQLARIREHVAAAIEESGGSPDVVDQFRLVASELATNAIEHHDGDEITVSVRGDERGWMLDVSNVEHDLQVDSPTLPAPSALSGRGLFLVDAMMDQVDLVEIDGRHHVRCVKHAP